MMILLGIAFAFAVGAALLVVTKPWARLRHTDGRQL